jgi:hypothetical protein
VGKVFIATLKRYGAGCKPAPAKQVPELALAKAVGSRRGKMKAAAFLEIISEKIELACLREVPAGLKMNSKMHLPVLGY